MGMVYPLLLRLGIDLEYILVHAGVSVYVCVDMLL